MTEADRLWNHVSWCSVRSVIEYGERNAVWWLEVNVRNAMGGEGYVWFKKIECNDISSKINVYKNNCSLLFPLRWGIGALTAIREIIIIRRGSKRRLSPHSTIAIGQSDTIYPGMCDTALLPLLVKLYILQQHSANSVDVLSWALRRASDLETQCTWLGKQTLFTHVETKPEPSGWILSSAFKSLWGRVMSEG